MIHVLAIITTKPGKRDEVLGLFRANMPAVHAEDGCVEYGPVIDAEGGFGREVRRRYVCRRREMGEPRPFEGARRLAAHGRLWREDQGSARQPRNPRLPGGRLGADARAKPAPHPAASRPPSPLAGEGIPSTGAPFPRKRRKVGMGAINFETAELLTGCAAPPYR